MTHSATYLGPAVVALSDGRELPVQAELLSTPGTPADWRGTLIVGDGQWAFDAIGSNWSLRLPDGGCGEFLAREVLDALATSAVLRISGSGPAPF